MNGLIRASLRNPIAVTVMSLTLVVLGGLAAYAIPIDILPVFKSPAVQVLTFYGGMPAGEHREGHHRTGWSAGSARPPGRPAAGVALDRRRQHRPQLLPQRRRPQRRPDRRSTRWPAGRIPTLPPGTLPPVVLPFDPTSTTPVCLRRPRQRDADRVDPLRRRPLRGPAT